MERSAKEAKKESESSGLKTVQQVLERMTNNYRAKSVLKELNKRGVQEETIAKYLLSYCGGNVEDAITGLRKAKLFADTLRQCAEKLKEAGNYVERTLQLCRQFNEPLLDEELLELLRRNAKLLGDAAEDRQERLKNIRIGGQGNQVSISSGRIHVLVRLAYALEIGLSKPGKRKPGRRGIIRYPSKAIYDQIAQLVMPVRDDQLTTYPNLAESLRRAVERETRQQFQRSTLDKQGFEQFLVEQAEDDYAELTANPTRRQ